nr:anti-sigma-F factor Fin [Desmospora activa]
MMMEYRCRYCNHLIGQIEDDLVTELDLGFHRLTPAERRDIIIDDGDGHTHVKVVCESCQEMLERNPDLLLLSRPFQ